MLQLILLIVVLKNSNTFAVPVSVGISKSRYALTIYPSKTAENGTESP